MENPDVILELTRNEAGLITQMSYKVCTRENEGRSALEFCELISNVMRPEDTNINVDVSIGGMQS